MARSDSAPRREWSYCQTLLPSWVHEPEAALHQRTIRLLPGFPSGRVFKTISSGSSLSHAWEKLTAVEVEDVGQNLLFTTYWLGDLSQGF